MLLKRYSSRAHKPAPPTRGPANKRKLASHSQFEILEARYVLDSTVVFNEIMYHPASDEALFEWIELYNQQSVDMDLSGWSLQGATEFTFAEGTVIGGRGHLVIAASPASLQAAAGIAGVQGPLVGRLGNSGEKLSLHDNNNRLLDEVDYQDDGDWPVAADGSGATLAKRDPATASAPASNWTFSTQVGGTPGGINFPQSNLPPTSSTLVDLDATWAYETSGTDLGTAWLQSGFDDSVWARHTAPLSTVSTSAGSALSFSGVGATLDGPFAGYVLGWEFNVTAPITVASVGWFDSGAGLSASHPVGIFNSTGGLLASATVLASDPLVSSVAPQPGAGFRYHALAAPLVLDVGTYRIGGLNPPGSNDKNYDFVQSITMVPEVSYVHSYYTASGSLSFPNTLGDREKGYFGANFQLAGGAPVLNLGPSTYYFRTTFPYTPTAGALTLSLESLVDDGAVFYLNGVEVYRQNMPAGNVTYSTLATSAVGTAALGGTVTIPAANLLPGNNVLAVEVHQASVADTDAAFNARLVATVTPLPPSALPQLVFNEVASGIDATIQVELVNQASQSVNLAGYVVSITDIPGRQYVLPAHVLTPGGFLKLTTAELGFDAIPGDHLFLYGPGRTALLDGVTVRDRLRARSVEYGGEWLFPDQATFGAPNHFTFRNDIVINEIMYHHQPVVAVPATYDDQDLIPLESPWRYEQSGVDQGTDWRAANFNDSGWSQGAGPFGSASVQSYDTAVLSGNPVAYWRLGENPPTGTAVDSAPLSGSQNGAYSSVATRAAVIGSTTDPAGDFNGTSSRVSGAGLNATGVFNGDWTIEGWFVHDVSTANGTIFSNNGASGNTNGPAMSFVDTTSRLGLSAVGTSTANVSIDLGASHYGKPVYAVITKTGGNTAGTNTITIYAWVDGVQLPTVAGSTTWNLTPNDAYYIGRYRNFGSQIFDGAIDEVALYNRALSAAEVSQHFTAAGDISGQPVTTPLGLGSTTYYFRHEFVYNGDPAAAQLTLEPNVDDGAVYYLNGVEVYRQNMPAGVIGHSTLATTAVGNAALSGPFTISNANLISGNNVLAVEVHQAAIPDTDVRFDVKLHAQVQLTPATTYQESGEEWIELYNRGSQTVDLGGWRLDRVIDYVFPPGTTLGAGQYLVVAKDKLALQTKYPNIAIVGDYLNQLTNSGGRIELKDGAGNPVDQVQYYDSGNWPAAADGGGSSLELRDSDADNTRAEAWQASDESGKSAWHTYTTRRIAQPYLGSFASPVGGDVPPTGFNEFIFGLLDSGEVLIDDVSLIETPGASPLQLIQNGSFQSDVVGTAPATWRSGGSQLASVVADPANPANRVLRIVSTGATGYIGNDVETTLVGNRVIVIGREYEVSFRAKWVGGSSQLNNRAYFTLIPETTVLDTPRSNGTPGAQNSRFSPNIGPTFRDFGHQPVVPQVGQPVTVSAVTADPDSVSAVTLRWSANGGSWNSLPMTASPSGVYTANIPGQNAATIVQFYVEAIDGLGAVSTFPAAGLASRALYEVNDGAAAPAATLGVDSFRIIMTAADSSKMHVITNLMSTADLGATLIVNEQEVFYDVGVQLKGSQHSRSEPTRVGFNLTLHPDQLLRGVHRKISIDRSSRAPSTPKPSPDEIVVKQFLNHAGDLASEYDDIAYVVAPLSAHNSVATLQMARLGSEYLDSQYANGNDGSIYEFEMIFTASGTTGGVEGQKLHGGGPFLDYDVEDLGPDKEVYRFHMQKRNNLAEDDFSRIIALGQALELTGTALDAAAAEVLDADQWMRTFAAQSLIMNFDGYGTPSYRHNHNFKFYVRPADQKVLAFLWDIDGAFNLSPTGPLWPQGGPNTLSKLIARPDNLHRFYGHLHDMIATTWNSTYMSEWMARYGAKSGQNLSVNLPLVQQRANYVLSQLPAQVPFAITTNGGANFSVDTPTVNLAGNGWVNVREIRIQGRAGEIAATWTSPTAWHAEIPLQAGAQLLTLQAYDFQGNLIGTDSITITSSIGSPQYSSLRISEVHYHPADPVAGSPFVNSDFEFIELQNISVQPLQLDGAELAGGIQFNFAPQLLAPGGYVLVVNNQAAFEARYGTGFNIAGEFSGNLSNSGEQIQLLDAANQAILDFTYQPAWAAASDGDGPSLVVINTSATTSSWNSAASWRASSLGDGSPGSLDPVTSVVARHVFYNNSKFDGNNSSANAADDAAIATDKTALLSGAGSFANYTSFSRGINGIMIDVAGLIGLPTVQDFIFRVGNDNTPGGWGNAPTPASITVRPGAGVAGSSRVTIVWPDGAIKKQWLQVTVNQSLGLAQADVFYFGNAIGDTGNSAASAQVNSTDELAARSNPRTFLNPAPINSLYDFNRDGLVNATDQLLTRSNPTTLATALKLMAVPNGVQAAAPFPLVPLSALERSGIAATLEIRLRSIAGLDRPSQLAPDLPALLANSIPTHSTATKLLVADSVLASHADQPSDECDDELFELLATSRLSIRRATTFLDSNLERFG